MKRKFLTCLAAAVFFVGCSSDIAKKDSSQKIDFRPITFTELPGWMDDNLSNALLPLSRSCKTLLRKQRSSWINGTRFAGRVKDWMPACQSIPMYEPDDETSRTFFKKWFQAYQVVSYGVTSGLFTGYFEPNLQGSLKKDGEYKFPIYKRPNDLISVNLLSSPTFS